MFRWERKKKQEIITGQKRTCIMIHISSYIIQFTTVHITEMIKEGKNFLILRCWRRQQVFLNRRYTYTRLNCVTSQKTARFTMTGVANNRISEHIVSHVTAPIWEWLHATLWCRRSCTHWAAVALEIKLIKLN